MTGGDQDGFAVTRADCEDIARCKPKVLKKAGLLQGWAFLSLGTREEKASPAITPYVDECDACILTEVQNIFAHLLALAF